MRLLAALVLAITSLVMFGTTPAQACSCAVGTPQEYAERAEVVFVGTVTSTDGGPKDRLVSYDVEVDRVFKGEVGPETSVVSSSMSSMCGLPGLPEGEPLLFFADPGSAGLTVNSCGGTGEARPGNLKALTAVLGEAHEPSSLPDRLGSPVTTVDSDEDDAGTAAWLVGGGLLFAAAVGGGVLIRRRRTS